MHSVINIPSMEYINRYMYLHKPSLRFAYFHLFVNGKRIGHLANEEVYVIYAFLILADSFYLNLSFQSLFRVYVQMHIIDKAIVTMI